MICLSSVLNSVRKNRDFVSREHEKRLPKIRIVQIFLPKSTNSTLDFVGCEISFRLTNSAKAQKIVPKLSRNNQPWWQHAHFPSTCCAMLHCSISLFRVLIGFGSVKSSSNESIPTINHLKATSQIMSNGKHGCWLFEPCKH